MSSLDRRDYAGVLRLLAFVLVAVVLFRTRGGVDWRHLVPGTPTTGGGADRVLLAGDDLAPDLVARLVASFRRDHPAITIVRQGGSTNRALERVINRESDLGLAGRAPTAAEQELARGAIGDTLLVHRLALGALVVWRAAGDTTPVTITELATRARSGPGRLVLPDPNDGTWGALLGVIAPGAPDSTAGRSVRFVADAAQVLESVRSDPGCLGVTSSLALPELAAAGGVHAVGVAASGAPVPPTYEKIGSGEYPLVHYLHLVARPGGGTAAVMFQAYLVGDDGQRRIERAGYLPARRALRTVVLSTDPIGESR